MRKKIGKIFIVLILIISILYVPMPKTYASLASNAQSESGPIPEPPPPSDDPNPPPMVDPPPTTETIETETISYPTTISGNVYEDMGLPDDSGESTRKEIPNILVNLVSENKIIESQRTKPDGSYYFSPPSGNYSTQFLYGWTRRFSKQQRKFK